MATARIRAEDIFGIALAVMAHVALLVWLVFHKEPPPPPPAQTVTVTLQGPVAEQAGSPSRDEARAAAAPQLAPDPAPPVEAAPSPQPPAPRPVPTPLPRATSLPPAPTPRPQPKAAPSPVPTQRALPKPPAPRAAVTPPKPSPARQSRIDSNFLPSQPKGASGGPSKPAGASRIGKDFLGGAASGSGKAEAPPGPAITPQIRSSLSAEVARQLKPKWQAPSGLDVDLLATTVEWNLNADGSLSGAPRVVGQSGVNSANRAQADRHKEQALRAIRLASPFRLPPHLYAGWRSLRFTFDRKLSQ